MVRTRIVLLGQEQFTQQPEGAASGQKEYRAREAALKQFVTLCQRGASKSTLPNTNDKNKVPTRMIRTKCRHSHTRRDTNDKNEVPLTASYVTCHAP